MRSISTRLSAGNGALYGEDAIPQRWIANLSGRTADRDDGRMFELLHEARRTFWDEEDANLG